MRDLREKTWGRLHKSLGYAWPSRQCSLTSDVIRPGMYSDTPNVGVRCTSWT